MTCGVELLCIGNELLLGKTLNTNATWLSTRITLLGGSVKRVTTVGDRVEEIRLVTKEILKRKARLPDHVRWSRPTFDDITILAVSKAMRVPLRVNKEALGQIKARYREIFSSRRFRLTKFRVKMATFPIEAKPIPNPVGTAPGMMREFGKTTVICLPGVPKELRAIFSEHVAPLIKLASGTGGHISQTICVSRIFESELAPLIDRVMKREGKVYVKSHPEGGEGRNRSKIRLDFSYTGGNLEMGRQAVCRAIAHMKHILAARAR